MWYSPKRLLAAGAILALAGSRCPAQAPRSGDQDPPARLPATADAGKTMTALPQALPGSTAAGARISPYSAVKVEGGTPAPVAAANCTAPGCSSCAAPGSGSGSESASVWDKPCPPALAYRTEYEYPPLGLFLHDHMQTQINNGIAARMMLYEYDFACGTTSLNVRGNDRLAQVAQLWKCYDYPLIVERTPYNPGLAEARRTAVLSQFAEMGLSVPGDRVVIGTPLAHGLPGAEAVIIYQNLLKQTLNAGKSQGGGGQGGIGQGLGIGLSGGSSGSTPQQ